VVAAPLLVGEAAGEAKMLVWIGVGTNGGWRAAAVAAAGMVMEGEEKIRVRVSCERWRR